MREKAASWEELADQMISYLVNNEELKRQPRKRKRPLNSTEMGTSIAAMINPGTTKLGSLADDESGEVFVVV